VRDSAILSLPPVSSCMCFRERSHLPKVSEPFSERGFVDGCVDAFGSGDVAATELSAATIAE